MKSTEILLFLFLAISISTLATNTQEEHFYNKEISLNGKIPVSIALNGSKNELEQTDYILKPINLKEENEPEFLPKNHKLENILET